MKEETLQSRPFKVTIKFKSDKTISNCSTNIDQLNNVTGESNTEPSPDPPGSPDQVKPSSAEIIENHITEDENNPSSKNSQNQLVLYDPIANGGEAENDPDPIGYQPPSFSRQHPFSNKTPRVISPAVGAFTVQCADCFKWRLIPTKEKYEEIREHIIEQPFSCETAREWKPEISCDSPPDITQDGSRLWAIDKPNIAQPPPGWQRLLRIRGEGGSKFADVYYVAPSGKRLRSMVEVQRYLDEHPHYVEEGVSLSQFSFQTPRPLNDNYVKKRSAPSRAGMSGSLDPLQVHPIAWRSPDVETDLKLSTNYYEASGLNPEVQSVKKKKTSAKKRYNSDVVYNQNEVNPEESIEL